MDVNTSNMNKEIVLLQHTNPSYKMMCFQLCVKDLGKNHI